MEEVVLTFLESEFVRLDLGEKESDANGSDEESSEEGKKDGAVAKAKINVDFLERNDFDLDRVSRAEKDRLRDKLMSVPGGPNPVEFHSAEYYKVPFVQALELVSRRGYYVERGNLADIVSIIVSELRTSLSKSLAFGQVTEDEAARIVPLLKSVNSQYIAPEAPITIPWWARTERLSSRPRRLTTWPRNRCPSACSSSTRDPNVIISSNTRDGCSTGSLSRERA